MTSITIHNGEGDIIFRDAIGVDNNGTLRSPDLPHGHLFIELDGQAYGSLSFREDAAGKPVIELGQYDATFDQWQPQNPLTDPEEV